MLTIIKHVAIAAVLWWAVGYVLAMIHFRIVMPTYYRKKNQKNPTEKVKGLAFFLACSFLAFFGIILVCKTLLTIEEAP